MLLTMLRYIKHRNDQAAKMEREAKSRRKGGLR